MASATLSQVSNRLQQACRIRLGLIRTQSQCWYTSQTGKPGTQRKDSKSSTTEKSSPAPPPPPAEKFDNTSYKVPEYYSHNQWSFYDIEKAMTPSRVPQPSSVRQPSK